MWSQSSREAVYVRGLYLLYRGRYSHWILDGLSKGWCSFIKCTKSSESSFCVCVWINQYFLRVCACGKMIVSELEWLCCVFMGTLVMFDVSLSDPPRGGTQCALSLACPPHHHPHHSRGGGLCLIPRLSWERWRNKACQSSSTSTGHFKLNSLAWSAALHKRGLLNYALHSHTLLAFHFKCFGRFDIDWC